MERLSLASIYKISPIRGGVMASHAEKAKPSLKILEMASRLPASRHDNAGWGCHSRANRVSEKSGGLSFLEGALAPEESQGRVGRDFSLRGDS